MSHHQLKTTRVAFELVIEGSKKAELRENDRDFLVGDILCLREWNTKDQVFTGRTQSVKVTCVSSCQNVMKIEGAERFVVLSFELYGSMTI